MSNGKDISTYGKNSRYNVLFDEFGFTPADNSSSPGGSHGNVIQMEYLTNLEIDYLFILDRTAVVEGSQSGLDDFLNNSILSNVSVIKNKHYITLNPEAWYLVVGGFTSTNQMINDINKFIKQLLLTKVIILLKCS